MSFTAEKNDMFSRGEMIGRKGEKGPVGGSAELSGKGPSQRLSYKRDEKRI